jgi:hypothetical protein
MMSFIKDEHILLLLSPCSGVVHRPPFLYMFGVNSVNKISNDSDN